MVHIDSETVGHLARLARLDITSEEHDRFAGQLDSVVAYADRLAEAEVSAESSFNLKNVAAADEPREAGDPLNVGKDLLLAGAPVHNGDFINVQAVMSADSAESA